MKIQHVITTLDVGGAEMHLLSQVRGQAAAGHEVRLAYLKGEGRLRDDFIQAGAREIEPIGFGPRTLFRLASLIRAADVCHSHLLKADMLVAFTAFFCGRRSRLISGKHNDEQVLKKPLVSFVHGILGRVPTRTIPLSDHVARFVERYGRVDRKKMTRIYYGIDRTPFEEAAAAPDGDKRALRESLGIQPEDVVFICVARFAAQKAHDVLLRAFAEARTVDPRLRLLLVGGDPFGDGVERAGALGRELELGESVIFAGIRRDVPALLAASDVFVMASLWEGLGLVFLEAMATNLPVLATDVSAVPEVVVDGETGRLVPPANVEALCGAMLELGQNEELRRRFAEAGAKRVAERFTLERMWRETLVVYEEVHRAASS